MTEQEIRDWEREIRHAKVMQEQRKSKREGWELKESEFNPIAVTPFDDTYTVKDNDNEINR